MVKHLSLFLFFALANLTGWSQTPTFKINDTTVDICDGILTDSDALFGGKYEKNEDFTFSICPGTGAQVVFTFNFLALEAVYDSIRFYDGPDTNSTFLGGWTGVQNGLPPIIANSGCMTIRFTSDGTLQLNGWDAMWTSISPPIIPPTMTTATTSPPTCDSNSFLVEFSYPIHCDSLRVADFLVTGTNAPNLTNVQAVGCAADSTRFARLTFDQPFQYNCPYDIDFNLKIRDVCDSVWEFIITDNFDFTTCKLPYTMSPGDTICKTNCANVEAQIVPGCNPVTFSWDNGLPATAGPHNVCPLTTTTYTVTITETNTAIQIIDSVTITVEDTLATDFAMQVSSGNNPQCGNGTFNVVFNPPLPCNLLDSGNFILRNGFTAPTVTNVTALNCTGDFVDSAQLTLDAPFSGNCDFMIDFDLRFMHDCMGYLTFLLTDSFAINGCPLTAVSSYPDTMCEGNCDSVSILANGCSTFSYSWSNGLPATAGPHNICPTADTSFTVTVTEDSTGLTYTETISIRVLPLGFDLTMEVDPGTPPNCTSNSVTINLANAAGCTNINENNFLLVGGMDTLAINSVVANNCVAGEATQFTLNLANTFNYNCDYILTFSFDTINACGDTFSVTNNDTIQINDCPLTHTVNYNNIVCETTCTGVRVSPIQSCYDLTYTWSNGLSDTNYHVICPDGDTTFTITITEDSTGNTTIDTISIRVDSSYDRFTIILDSTNYLPACDSTQLFVKFDKNVLCDSIYTAAFRLTGGNVNVINATPTGCTGPGDSTMYAVIELDQPLAFGTDYRIYYYINALECRTSINFRNIRIEPHQTDYAFADTCFYQTTSFMAFVDSLTDMDSLRWNFDDPASGAANTSTTLGATHQFNTPGTYAVELKVYYGCEVDTIIKQVIISPPLTVDITGNLYLCPGISTTLDAGAGFATYLWSAGDITQTMTTSTPGFYSVIVGDGTGCSTGRDTVEAVLGLDLITNITGPLSYCPGTGTTISADSGFVQYIWSSGDTTQDITTNVPAVYSVIVHDSLGCSGYDTVEVVLGANLPTNITGVSLLCPGITTTLDAGAGYVSYSWNTGDTTQSILNMGAGNYFVFVQDAAGCSGYDTIDVAQHPDANLTITGDTTYCLGNFTMLDAGDGFFGYNWGHGLVGQEIMVSKAGEYTIRALDANSCWAYDTIQVTSKICIDTCNVIVPNAFSPNGDGANDVFGPTIQSCEIDEYEFFIYDRWGQLVFKTDKFDNFWDGTYKGKLAEIDVFVWLMRYKAFDDPRIKSRTGHVSIIR